MKKKMGSIKALKEMKPLKGMPIDGIHEDMEPDQYELDDALRTLEKAEQIKKDEELMGHLHKHFDAKLTSLKSLKKLAGKAAMKEQEEPGEEM